MLKALDAQLELADACRCGGLANLLALNEFSKALLTQVDYVQQSRPATNELLGNTLIAPTWSVDALAVFHADDRLHIFQERHALRERQVVARDGGGGLAVIVCGIGFDKHVSVSFCGSAFAAGVLEQFKEAFLHLLFPLEQRIDLALDRS